MKRKFWLILTSVIAAACLLSGCGDKEGSSMESSTTLGGSSEYNSDANTSETDSKDSSDETEDRASASSETPVPSDSGEEESSGEAADASRPPEGSSSAVSKPASNSSTTSTTSRPSSSSSSSSKPSSSSSSSSKPSSSSSSSSKPSSSSSSSSKPSSSGSSSNKPSSSSEESSAAEDPSAAKKSCADIYAAATAGVSLPNMMSLSGDDLNVIYGEIDLTGISDYSINVAAMMVHASEVVIFKYENQTGRKNAMEIINTRAENLVSLWERYLPDQFELVEARQVVEKNGYILFVIAEDAERIVSQFEAAAE